MALVKIPMTGRMSMAGSLTRAWSEPARLAKIHLFANDITPSIGTVLADLTEIGFSGYAPIDFPTVNPVLTWDVTNNRAIVETDIVRFTAALPGSGLPNIAFGYWVDYPDPRTGQTELLWAKKFADAVALLNVGDRVSFTLSLSLTQGA